MMIPSVTLRKKRIVESEELGKYESGPLWVVDEDYKSGRELNFKRLDELSGVYEVYLDAEILRVDDVADSITGGATMVTISERMEREKMKMALFYTDSLILYVRSNKEVTDFFRGNGGSRVYSDSSISDVQSVDFTSILGCQSCNIVMPIGGFNGRRDTQTPALP